jgi:hypothetical protein
MQVETLAVTYVTTESGVRVVMQTGDDVRIMRAGTECQFRIIGDAGTIAFYGWESAYWLVNARHPNGERFAPPRNTRTGHQPHLEQLAEQIDRAAPTTVWPKARSRRWNCARRPIFRPSTAAWCGCRCHSSARRRRTTSGQGSPLLDRAAAATDARSHNACMQWA